MDAPRDPDAALAALEAALGHTFRDRALLVTALTHRSYTSAFRQPTQRKKKAASALPDDNQRLEFLGDAVIDLVATEVLYTLAPEADEGRLTQHRAALVHEARMATAARQLDLGPLMRVGPGPENEALRLKASVLADAFEAVAAALYLDGGYDVVRRLFARLYAADLAAPRPHVPAKAAVQEIAQSRWKLTPVYAAQPLGEGGFEAVLSVGDALRARGVGPSKRLAEEDAAKNALAHLEAPPKPPPHDSPQESQ